MTPRPALGSGEFWFERKRSQTETETMTPVPHQYSQTKEDAMTREEFVIHWRTRQSEWARIGALVDGARVCEDVLQDFEAVTRTADDAELNLSEAATESGYSSDHLRRLHRLGKLPAVRKGRSLFFRSGDPAKKPTAPNFVPYDLVVDARRVTSNATTAIAEDA